ncbi:Hypothetical_protein [Hexamita inflata]|uniref:Hypothetical_protein n=1 Tax=Hexamita inflata TaxID=28002 RepID=A0AA86TW21_9EUKA|nr:Hypothetical protein HINF_LOCUS16907 [Hexamita inflata]
MVPRPTHKITLFNALARTLLRHHLEVTHGLIVGSSSKLETTRTSSGYSYNAGWNLDMQDPVTLAGEYITNSAIEEVSEFSLSVVMNNKGSVKLKLEILYYNETNPSICEYGSRLAVSFGLPARICVTWWAAFSVVFTTQGGIAVLSRVLPAYGGGVQSAWFYSFVGHGVQIIRLHQIILTKRYLSSNCQDIFDHLWPDLTQK